MMWLQWAAGLAMGLGFGWQLCAWLERKRRRVLSNWEPGMVITMSSGETLYVCAVEPSDSGGEEP
jgi:hypothetical protein